MQIKQKNSQIKQKNSQIKQKTHKLNKITKTFFKKSDINLINYNFNCKK